MTISLCIKGREEMTENIIIKPSVQERFDSFMAHGRVLFFSAPCGFGKTVLADGKAAFVGSVNMDYRSFQLHFECGTLLYGTEASQPLAEDMARIMAQGQRVTMARWKGRPWYQKALGTLLRLFAMWM